MNDLWFDFSQHKSLKSFYQRKTNDRGILQEYQPEKQPASPNVNKVLRRSQNFAKSSPYFWLQYIESKEKGRFRKILWPSQNIWTLKWMNQQITNENCLFYLTYLHFHSLWNVFSTMVVCSSMYVVVTNNCFVFVCLFVCFTFYWWWRTICSHSLDTKLYSSK